MFRENINEIMSFIVVAKECSFTKEAAKLGVSQSALSHSMRALENRLGLRLLTRTTRRVIPTIAGERLLKNMGPLFAQMEKELSEINGMRDKPAGTIRINAGKLT